METNKLPDIRQYKLPDIADCTNIIYRHAACYCDREDVPCPRHNRTAFEVWCVAKYDRPPIYGWVGPSDTIRHYIYISEQLGINARFVWWVPGHTNAWGGAWEDRPVPSLDLFLTTCTYKAFGIDNPFCAP